jgi:CheY-like chemotaxis protein
LISAGVNKLTRTTDRLQRTKQPRLLLAEDNQENINLFQDYLQVQGFQVVVARNGSEAIERAQAEKPDLILMDLQMPGMDGLEATRRLRADPIFSQTPIITLTALAMTGDRERCLAAGANEYLSKPVNLELLVRTINSYLN